MARDDSIEDVPLICARIVDDRNVLRPDAEPDVFIDVMIVIGALLD